VKIAGKLLKSAALLLAALAPCACGKRYLVAEAKLADVKGRATERDVRRTPNYLSNFQTIHTVGFRAPDTCFIQAAERAGNGSIYEVAKQLGADLVFILNALEAEPIRGGTDVAATFTYYHSDPRGSMLGEYPLTDEQRRLLGGYMSEKINLAAEQSVVRALSAVLDTTAILAANGEAVWYYRWGVLKPVGDSSEILFLFRGRNDTWRPVLPVDGGRMPASGTMSSKDVVVANAAASAESQYQADLFALVQTVAKDFVVSLRAGAH
jgi:hypothetical protein